MIPYTISQSYVRIGLINLPGEKGLTLTSTFLGGINSRTAFSRNLDQADELIDPGPQEYIVKALQIVNDPYKCRAPSNGYRPTITNHLIVILTERTDFEDVEGAAKAALDIRDSNTYGIITIGYGPRVEKTKLERLSTSECNFMAADLHELNTAALNFTRSQIWNAFKNPTNAYCMNAN